MVKLSKKINPKWFLYIFLLVWFLLQFSFLTEFPFMHSDESWLSTLSRDMLVNKDLGVTESVFDVMPRYPHAIKVVFHLVQMAFIQVFGYQLFSVRLISLVCGVGVLYFFYRLIEDMTESTWLAIVGMVLLAVDVQFIYATHFARAEAMLLLVLVWGLWLTMHWRETHLMRHDVLLGILLGVAVGIHPNALFVALAIGCVYVWQWYQKKIKFVNLLLLVLVVGVLAGLFVGISFIFDGDFIRHYFTYGSTLGVDETFIDKVRGLFPYFGRLFTGESGTYYTPDVRLQLIVFLSVILFSALVAIKKTAKPRVDLLFALIGIVVGMVIVGRYSQPSVIFVFVVYYALLIGFVDGSRVLRNGLLILLLCVVGVQTIQSIRPFLNSDYENYLAEIYRLVPADAVVLANLNTEYAFEAGHLFDYRNLTFLNEEGISFAEYVEDNQIEYIVLPDEMGFIYARRPAWNVMYGNLYPVYDELRDFLNDDCELMGSFTSPYAMRIIRFMYDEDWMVRVYQVRMAK